MKALYYGDNLQVLRDNIANESVDLIYLYPPFNSNASYNVGLLGESGRDRMRGRTAACSQERKSPLPNCTKEVISLLPAKNLKSSEISPVAG